MLPTDTERTVEELRELAEAAAKTAAPEGPRQIGLFMSAHRMKLVTVSEDYDGPILHHEYGKTEVYLRQTDDHIQSNWIIARAIAHLALHQGTIPEGRVMTVPRDYDDMIAENPELYGAHVEATIYASFMLMPHEEFKLMSERPPEDLVEYFGIPAKELQERYGYEAPEDRLDTACDLS